MAKSAAQIRPLVTFILVASLWLVFLIHTFFTEGEHSESASDIIMFALAIVLGVLLIRASRRETRQLKELRVMTGQLRDWNANLGEQVESQTQTLQKNYAEEKKLREEHERTIKLLIQRDIELRSTNDRLERMTQEKSEFISVAAHELRTPLTAIKWIAQILAKAKAAFPPDQAEQVVKLNAIVDKMVALVGDILNVARIEEGRFGLKFEPKDILAILQTVLGTAEVNAQAKDVRLASTVPPEPIALNVDAERITLALDNIVSNAIKYTPQGGQVTVSAEKNGEQLTIAVADTGIGIPPEEQERLFSKFFRAANALKLDTEGTGLGLFISKNIIEAHHGQIEFTSELLKGTTFKITLPLPKAA